MAIYSSSLYVTINAQANDNASGETVAPTSEQVAALTQHQDKFDLLELRVKGNNQLERQVIERVVYPFLGKQKSIDTVEKARQALEEIYHTKGYQTVSVDIPEQNVTNGVVYLQVNEGKISRLRVTDSRYFSLGAIKEKIPALAEGSVPNMPQMQEQLTALAKETPDRTITPVLRAGDTPGTLEADLKVKDELPLHGKFEINGRNTTNTDRLRAIASMHFDNLWQKFHSASIMYQFSPENPNQVDVLVGSYAMPLFNSETRLAFFAIDSASNSVSSAGSVTIIGTGNIFGVRYVDPIYSSIKNFVQTFTLGTTYKNNLQTSQPIGGTAQSTPFSYLPFMAGYNGSYQGAESLTTVNVNGNLGFRGIGNVQNQTTGTNANFMYVNGGVSYNQNLPYGMEFAGRFNGQASSTTLVPYERFSLGGQQSVRGYFETEVLADSAVQGSIELYTPKINIADWSPKNKLRGLVFFDAGSGWAKNQANSALVNQEFNLASAGAGFRMQIWKLLTANFDVGVPFIGLHPYSQYRIESGNPRLHFQVFTEF